MKVMTLGVSSFSAALVQALAVVGARTVSLHSSAGLTGLEAVAMAYVPHAKASTPVLPARLRQVWAHMAAHTGGLQKAQLPLDMVRRRTGRREMNSAANGRAAR